MGDCQLIQELIKYVGRPTYLRMLRRSKPENKEQWAYCVLLRMKIEDRHCRAKLRALQESSSILSRGIIGEEDEQLAEEWAEYAQRLG